MIDIEFPLPAKDLVERAVRNLAKSRRGRRKREPFWGVVQEVFGLGSTYSCMLARACGLDPDSGEDVKP